MFDPAWVPRFLTIWVSGVAHDVDDLARALGRPIVDGDVEVLTMALAQLGGLVSASAYLDAWRWLQGAARRIAAFFGRYDLFLTPTLAAPPAPLGHFRSPPDDPLAGIMRAAEYAPFTPPFNATGQPACSLPLYRSAEGLPIGVQLVAPMYGEDRLVRVAAQLEAAQPFEHAATLE
jgi:amidase